MHGNKKLKSDIEEAETTLARSQSNSDSIQTSHGHRRIIIHSLDKCNVCPRLKTSHGVTSLFSFAITNLLTCNIRSTHVISARPLTCSIRLAGAIFFSRRYISAVIRGVEFAGDGSISSTSFTQPNPVVVIYRRNYQVAVDAAHMGRQIVRSFDR